MPLREPAWSVCTDLLVCIKYPLCVCHVMNISNLSPRSVFSARRAVDDLLWIVSSSNTARCPSSHNSTTFDSHVSSSLLRCATGPASQHSTTLGRICSFCFDPARGCTQELKKKMWTPLISCEWSHMWPSKGALSTPIFSSAGGREEGDTVTRKC
jgi:hypothetical protein